MVRRRAAPVARTRAGAARARVPRSARFPGRASGARVARGGRGRGEGGRPPRRGSPRGARGVARAEAKGSLSLIPTPPALAPPLPTCPPSAPARWVGLDRERAVVRSYLLRRCKDESDAEDLTQETLVRAARYRHALTDGGRLRGWLLSIAGNVFRDHLRRRERGVVLTFDDELLDQLEDEEAAPGAVCEELVHWELEGAQIERDDLLAMLRCAVADLAEQDRLVLARYYGDGDTTTQIAAGAGLSASGVKIRLFRTRQRLLRQVRERVERRRTNGFAEVAG